MRIFTKKNATVKPSLKEALKKEVSLKPKSTPSSILKFKKSKKTKIEDSLKQTLLEWLEKMVTSQTSDKLKSFGVLKFLIDKLQGGSGLRESNSHEAGGEDADRKGEYIHEIKEAAYNVEE